MSSNHHWRIQTALSSLFLLITVLPDAARSYTVHDAITDTVGPGEARFYTVESQSPLIVALFSDVGDADMYAAATSHTPKPSCEKYDVTSTSCGLDVILLEMKNNVRRMTVGVYGHVRYDESKYRLYIIEPSQEDIMKHQIWDWDPEVFQEKLVIDVDPLVLVNDPIVHELLDQLAISGDGTARTRAGKSQGGEEQKGALEWIGVILLKIIEIAIEVLA